MARYIKRKNTQPEEKEETMMTRFLKSTISMSGLALTCSVFLIAAPVSAQTEVQPSAKATERQIDVQPKPPVSGETPPDNTGATPPAGSGDTPPPATVETAPPAGDTQPPAAAVEEEPPKNTDTASSAPPPPAPPVTPANVADANAELAAIPKPSSEIEKAAYDALNKHCARCHQTGKLDRLKPAKGFGNVLHLRELANDPNLVLPGNPDGSKLLQQILNQNMPYDYYKDGDVLASVPDENDIKAISTWITSLAATRYAACEGRTYLYNEGIINKIAEDLNSLPDHRIKNTRYITLTHLYNSCATDKAMNVYRQAVIKLLNSLSYNSDVVTLHTIDEGKTIIRFNLDDLKWTTYQWDRMTSVYPYGIVPDVKMYKFITGHLYTQVPYIRGDWFAFSASRPPLYHDLLKLPHTFQELAVSLGVNVKHDIENYIAQRAGFQKSLVSRNNRLIERHTGKYGVFWTSYDFGGSGGRQSLFSHPIGPFAQYGVEAFKANGGETIFSLPNGFNAYFLSVDTGKRIDKGPTSIVIDPDRRDFSVANGISCMGCHDHGFRAAKDDIRNHVIKDRNYPKQVRDAVEALYPTHDVMDGLLKKDLAKFHAAMLAAGLDPSLKLEGVEMINALSNRYEKDVDLLLAAAEYGLGEKDFVAAASDRGGEIRSILRRLQQATVPRDEFENQFPKLIAQVTDDVAIIPHAPDATYATTTTAEPTVYAGTKKDPAYVAPPVVKHAPAYVAKVNHGDNTVYGKFSLTLFANKTGYNQYDLPVFIVQSTKACYLTLINVDSHGTGTVIYPNKYQQDNFIKANHAFEFPGPSAPFQFRLKDKGYETVIALCNAKGKYVDNIAHRFKKAAFTNLGNYRAAVTRAIGIEAVTHKNRPSKAHVVKVPTSSGIARAAIKVIVH